MFDKIKDKFQNAKLEVEMKKDDIRFLKEDIQAIPWKKILIGLLTLPFILWAFLAWFLATEEMVKVTKTETRTIDTVVVQKKDPTGKLISVSQNVDKNFVYTDRGAFIYEPTWFYLKEEVSNEYGAIENETYYVLTHYGVRFSFFSYIRWYENIIGYRKPTPDEIREYLQSDPQALAEFESKMTLINNLPTTELTDTTKTVQ